MDFPQIIRTSWLQLLFLTLAWGLAPHFAAADVIITDLTEAPVTAFVTDSLNPGDNTPADKPLTADKHQHA